MLPFAVVHDRRCPGSSSVLLALVSLRSHAAHGTWDRAARRRSSRAVESGATIARRRRSCRASRARVGAARRARPHDPHVPSAADRVSPGFSAAAVLRRCGSRFRPDRRARGRDACCECERHRRRARRNPGVESAAFASSMPLEEFRRGLGRHRSPRRGPDGGAGLGRTPDAHLQICVAPDSSRPRARGSSARPRPDLERWCTRARRSR